MAATIRKPIAGFATYPGNCTHMAIDGEVVGPNLLGEFLQAVTADHDAETDTTRVGFDYYRPNGGESA